MNLKQSFAVILLSTATTIGSVWGYGKYQEIKHLPLATTNTLSATKASFADYNGVAAAAPAVDFEKAATKAAPAVVHIKVSKKPKQVSGGSDMQKQSLQRFFWRWI